MELLKTLKEWAPLAILAGMFVYGFFSKMFKKKKNHPSIDVEVKFSVQIYNALTDLLFRYPATRVFIKQFHNGNEFYSGQKIQRLTISHEKCIPDIKPIKSYHDGVQVPAEVHDILGHMESNHTDYFWCSDLANSKDSMPELFSWMRTHGVVSVLYFRLADKKTGQTIGLLGFTFNHKFRLDEDVDILDMRKFKKELENEFGKV